MHQVEQYAEQMKGKIQVAKRAAEKAEVDILQLEKNKLEQVFAESEE